MPRKKTRTAPAAPSGSACPVCGDPRHLESRLDAPGTPCWRCQRKRHLPPSEPASSKACTACGETKRFDDFYRDRQKRDGRSCRCKLCLDAANKARHAARPVLIITPTGPRTCSHCRVKQPGAEFGPTSKGLFHSHCRTCRNAAKRAHYQKNRDAIRAKALAAYHADIEASRAKSRAARRRPEAKEAIHRSRKTDEGRRRHCERNRRYRLRHPDREAARSAAKYAIRKGCIVRPDMCQVAGCSRPAVEAHHIDYDRPLDVVHICRPHHADLHRIGVLPLKAGGIVTAPPRPSREIRHGETQA